MKRKYISLFLALVMILSLVPMTVFAGETQAVPVSAATLTDIPVGKNGEIIRRAVENGLLRGAGDKVLPNSPLTRAQMAAIITRAFGATGMGDLSKFTDVAGNGLYNELAAAYKMGVLNGSGNKMNPRQNITRQEAFVIIARALQLAPAATMERSFADAASVSNWAKGEINAMVNAGYVNGDGKNLHLNQSITRMQFATVFDNVLKTYIKTAGTVSTVAEGNVMVNVPGVTLKNCTVKGDLIIGDGVGNGDFTLDHVVVTGRTVVRGGGIHSFRIMGSSKLGDVLIAKTDDGGLRVVASGGATVETLFINDGKDNVVVEGKFGNMQIASNTPVTLQNAEIKTVTATGENANVTVDQGSKVDTVATAQVYTTIIVQGTVTTVAATKEAVGLRLIVSKDGTATNVTTAAPNFTLSNDGKVGIFSASKDATGAKLVVGKESTMGKIVLEDKTNLTTTTAAAETAAKAEAAAKEATAKAAADKAAADKALTDAKTAEAKAEAEAAQKAATEAAAKAEADKAAAEKNVADSKAEADKAAADAAGKTEKKPVAPPVVNDKGEITVPDNPSDDSDDSSTPTETAQAALRAAIHAAIPGTNTTLSGIATLALSGNTVTVTIPENSTKTAMDVLSTNFLAELFAYSEIKTATIGSQTITMSNGTAQKDIMKTVATALSITDASIPITVLRGNNVSVTLSGRTGNGLDYSDTYTVHFI